jgi:hypothetical protein
MTRGKEGLISAPDSIIKVLVIPANEELVVAREVKRYLDRLRPAQRPARLTRKPAREADATTTLARLKSKLKSTD